MSVWVDRATLEAGDTPIIGISLTPKVTLRADDPNVNTPTSLSRNGHGNLASAGLSANGLTNYKKISADSFREAGDGVELKPGEVALRSRWYRCLGGRTGAFCSRHPDLEATVQCLGCVKLNVPISRSYFCSTQCFAQSWPEHKKLLKQYEEENNGKSSGRKRSESSFGGDSTNTVHIRGPGGESWVEVARTRTYTPGVDDIGHVLKYECVPVSKEHPHGMTAASTLETEPVAPKPKPPTRSMVPLALDGIKGSVATGKFTLLTYNVLSDIYANPDMYTNCPRWALKWSYRRMNLVNEIVSYRPDIFCLQEVQSDHYENFFKPEMSKYGYDSVYKKKTSEVYAGGNMVIDGCGTFYRRDRFSIIKKYDVEFNKAALSLSEALNANSQKKAALNRLLKDNVALIVVLEALEPPDPAAAAAGKRQLLCVANTHIHANSELKDVKLWQVHTLLKGLEKIAASANIPMLVAGDFNSIPGSAAHSLLAQGRVPIDHPELSVDPLGILRPPSKLCHQLPLMSAYAALAQQGPALQTPSAKKQKKCMDEETCEPRFTNYTVDFNGAIDYMFYTGDSLVTSAVLELPDESDILRRNISALPNAEWSSDHIALMAEFRFFKY
uniref:Carbon catabolite repressor protein n=1 Tax=Chloropicon roscoffensis TaxID=1461544 RepID=A0A7S2X3A0_9CHLO|mmetsp:Transcript_2307/g.7760  ORF Transcript_2307/g.7760 Transcript_2307/m.7760 type:complete len:613 (+) Transcript_2307:100-1938(+)